MPGLLRVIVVLAICALVTPAPAARLALVIGNAEYAHSGVLANPARDATAFADFLRGTGFEVTLATDLTRAGMGAAVTEFVSRIEPDDVAVFYYSGHGVQQDGQNFLMGTEALLRNSFDIPGEGIALDQVISLLERQAKVSMIFIDACRNNPLAQAMVATRSISNGLAPVMPQGEGTMVAFAAAAGQVAYDGVGDHSPFTSALIAHLAEPGLEVATAFKRVIRDVREATLNRQSPQVVSSLATEFYFGGEGIAPAPQPSNAVVADIPPAPAIVPLPIESAPVVAAEPGPDAPAAFEPLAALEQAANGGDAEAMFKLGERYGTGEGVDKDPAIAAGWFMRAAEAGNARAMVALGRAYARGDGLAEDDALAAQWYRRAADGGNADGMRLLAASYLKGEGVPRDEALAFSFYRRAADAGDTAALAIVGYSYVVGRGVDKNLDAGVALVRQAAEAGEGTALYVLGHLHRAGAGVPKDYAAAVKAFDEAVAAGDPNGHFGLCISYDAGQGVPRSAETAAEECYKALRGGAEDALNALVAVGLDKDFTRALQRLLAADGYYAGSIDGARGPRMKAALEKAFGSAGS